MPNMGKLFFFCSVICHLLHMTLFVQETDHNYRILPLKNGELFIPSRFQVKSETLNLIIHFHGKASVVQEAFLKSEVNGLLITIHLGMLSGPYRIAFSDSNYFETILREALDKLKKEAEIDLSNKQLKIFLTSFSAGYGGIREILKYENYYKKINGIVLLDGLHTDYIQTDKDRFVNPVQMQDFLRFAKDAVHFKKQFIITHSEIIPDGYSSTTETAQYLLDSTETEKVFAEKLFDELFIQKYYAFNGNFRVFGFYGNKALDHMKHFYNLDKFLRMLMF